MKKTVIFLMALLMILQTVSATGIESLKPKQGNEDVFVLSGSFGSLPGEKLTITIFQAGKTFADIKEFGKPTDVIVFADTTTTTEGGKFEMEWTPVKSGKYDIFAAGSGRVISLENAYVPAGLSAISQTIKSGSLEQIVQLLSDSNNVKALIRDEALLEKLSNTRDLATAVYNMRAAAADKTNIEPYINAAAMLQILSEKKTVATMTDAFEAMESLGLTLTCDSDYKTYATDAIQKDMASNMGGISKKSFDEIDTYISERLVLSGVFKSPNWMDSINFLNIISYPSDTSKMEKAAKAVTGKRFNSIGSLKSAIDSALNPADNGKGGYTGGGYTGGGYTFADSGNIVVDPELPSITDNVETVFNDVSKSHYAFDAINYLRWHDVVTGDENGNFNPDNLVTRAEIVKMLCGVFEIEAAHQNSFTDVEPNAWYYGYIGGAYKSGVLKGDLSGNFNPNSYVTREDLSVMIWRLAEASEDEFNAESLQFTDKSDISDYALEAVLYLTESNIINGMGDGSFAPKAYADRAQAASLLARYMKSMAKE